MRKILVTSALPYANGSIHLGHLVEYLQTDIWVRNQKMSGNTCYYICADDAHGTPIMLKAKELDVKPEELIQKTYQEHVKDFEDFGIEFDNYYTTHSEEIENILNLSITHSKIMVISNHKKLSNSSMNLRKCFCLTAT